MLRIALVFLFFLMGHFIGCAPKCDGVEANGHCETTCHDDACLAGSKCVENACRPTCKAPSDCPDGQLCHRRITDYGSTGSYCAGPSPSNASTGGTDHAPCKASSDCEETYGYRCVAKVCTLTCEVHADCGTRGSCTGTAKDAEGHAARTCQADSFQRATGQYGTSCPNGTECDDAHDFKCVGAGPGDIDAYCTGKFCADDSACPSGSFCSTSLSRQVPCVDACGMKGDSTAADCVTADDIGPGKHFQCGPVQLVSNICLHREFCNECSSDADCLGKPNQICAKDESGAKICTVLCDLNLSSCPWGNAARCGIWDTDLGVATCEHRFGSCTGTGVSCQPCVEQTDCPKGWCNEAQFTGERYCVDTSVTCTCSSDTKASCTGGGCPNTPAGHPMTCLGGTVYAGTPLLGECVGAPADSTQTASKESCWPRL